MARSFKISNPVFNDDFLYQPNLELMKEVISKKDAEVQQQIATINMFKNIPLDYWDEVDSDMAMAIKSNFENQAAEIARNLASSNNVMDIQNNQMALNELSNAFQKEYEFGRIKQLRDNANNYRTIQQNLSKLDPTAQEAYKNAVVDKYIQGRLDGSISGNIEVPTMYNTTAVWEEFLKSPHFSTLGIDEISWDSQGNDGSGMWVTKQGGRKSELKEDKIKDAFDNFLNDRSDIKGYVQNRATVLGEEGWINPNGSLDFSNTGRLKSIANVGAKNAAFSKRASSYSKTESYENQLLIQRKYTNASNSSTMGGVGLIDSMTIDELQYTEEGRKTYTEYENKFNNFFDKYASTLITDPESLRKWNNGTPEQKKELQLMMSMAIQNLPNSNIYKEYSILAEGLQRQLNAKGGVLAGYDQKTRDAIEAQYRNTAMVNHIMQLDNISVNFNKGSIQPLNHQKFITEVNGIEQGNPIRMNELKEEIGIDENGDFYKIVAIEIPKEGLNPFNLTTPSNGQLTPKGVAGKVLITYLPVKREQRQDKTVYSEDTSREKRTEVVDFSSPETTLHITN